jgi:hypothetical protein
MRTHTLIVLAGIQVFLSGCTKEGPEGPQGPAGLGGSLTVHADYFPFPPQSAWTGSGTTSYRTTLLVPTITQDILMNGFVRVHRYEVTSGDTIFSVLPFSVNDPLPVVTYSHTDTIGAVTISTSIPSGFHQNPGNVFSGAQYGFRIATIR